MSVFLKNLQHLFNQTARTENKRTSQANVVSKLIWICDIVTSPIKCSYGKAFS